mmetsp:Transcript_4085/g.11607  ORF Transcript_4085/g.11607 Transcript_4085/m.11607 type:complete len:218 (-) Transcript_4085:74-727(-)
MNFGNVPIAFLCLCRCGFWLARGEAMDPPLMYTMRPVHEEYPDFARGDPPIFIVAAKLSHPAETVWGVIKQQKRLINSMKAVVERMNGTEGEEEMIVKWETPKRWHRWHRTDVRKYVNRDDATMTNSFFLCGGFGLWLPRLAFSERLVSTGPSSSTLFGDVWYELDEKYIGWPTDNLKNLTFERWEEFYTVDYKTAIDQLIENDAVAQRNQSAKSEL